MRKLTARQGRFVGEYLRDLNATKAAIRAGYSTAHPGDIGAQLLSKPHVLAAVEAAKERRALRVDVSADDILRELLTFARTDIGAAFDSEGRLKPVHEMPEDVRRAISGIEVEELWGFEMGQDGKVPIGQVKKVKFWDKVKGLELLGKHLKMWVDKVELSADGSFADALKKARERAGKR
jgi:phage terminase small subunit